MPPRFAPMGPGKPSSFAAPDPQVALLLSILLPGMGHAYLKQIGYGIMFLALAIGIWAFHILVEPCMKWELIAAHLLAGMSAWISAVVIQASME